jgi:hypothetical protein
LPARASITGITLTELAYIGMPKRTAKGTVHHDWPDK